MGPHALLGGAQASSKFAAANSGTPVKAAAAQLLWGWAPTPGIVSVHAEHDGRAVEWRRIPETGALVREDERFRPWLFLDRLDDLRHLGPTLGAEGDAHATVWYRELAGPGALRWLVSAGDGRTLCAALLRGASARLERRVGHVRDLPNDTILWLPPDEQYLVATGRTYFRDLPFDALQRLQFDLETTGLDARRDRIFMVSVRYPNGGIEVLEATGEDPAAEADLIRRLVERVRAADPDVVENHNLHGFDLPFLDRRPRTLGVPLALGRIGEPGLRTRAALRGAPAGDPDEHRRVRFVAPGRELIDTLDAVRRHDVGRRDLPGNGLKAVARHLGIAAPDREYIRGDRIHETYRTDPERVRRYATDDVQEVAELSRMLGGPSYALAQLMPRRYERLADAGAATGIIDPTLVRAYLRAGQALPAHEAGDGTPHSGAALHLFATGVAHRVVKADVASLYPSLMRAYRIGPARDRIGALLALVDDLVERRLDAKARARAAAPGSAERHAHDAKARARAAAPGSAERHAHDAMAAALTRFADVHAANEVTRRGREVLALLCWELAARGVTLIEADTDGVYFAVPEAWTEADERRVVSEVAALLPPLVQLELEGRYAAMLSHEPKNYALLDHDGTLTLRGVAFRSSRSEPSGERFLRGDRAAARPRRRGRARGVPRGDRRVARPRAPHVRRRVAGAAHEVAGAVRRVARQPARAGLRALLADGRARWRAGDRVQVYRKQGGEGGVSPSADDAPTDDPRDYDAEYYVRLLRSSYAERLARAFTPEDFGVVFADADQLTLFAPPLHAIRPILRRHP